jgi:hypothetical protein
MPLLRKRPHILEARSGAWVTVDDGRQVLVSVGSRWLDTDPIVRKLGKAFPWRRLTVEASAPPPPRPWHCGECRTPLNLQPDEPEEPTPELWRREWTPGVLLLDDEARVAGLLCPRCAAAYRGPHFVGPQIQTVLTNPLARERPRGRLLFGDLQERPRPRIRVDADGGLVAEYPDGRVEPVEAVPAPGGGFVLRPIPGGGSNGGTAREPGGDSRGEVSGEPALAPSPTPAVPEPVAEEATEQVPDEETAAASAGRHGVAEP